MGEDVDSVEGVGSDDVGYLGVEDGERGGGETFGHGDSERAKWAETRERERG